MLQVRGCRFSSSIIFIYSLRAISGTPSIPYERLYRLRKWLQSTEVLQAFYRSVFWLPDHPTCCAFPFLLEQWPVQRSFPVTAAGPRRIHTVFPGSLVLNHQLYHDMLFDGTTVNKILINAWKCSGSILYISINNNILPIGKAIWSR